MEKVIAFIPKLITHVLGIIVFVGIPLIIIANLDKIRTFLKNTLSKCESRFPIITKYFIGPVAWVILILVLAPILIWGGIIIINFIFVRSAAIQGY
jgi:hypothetical protein